MLEEILDYIHNYFVVDEHEGKFKIESGGITLDFLQPNQYFKVKGSVFNDGIHQYGVDELVDEEFVGTILSMAVPVNVLNIATEIKTWCDNNNDVVNSPYQSESFGGYSYSKAKGGDDGSQISWRSVFGNRLNAYRKIS